MSEPIPVLPEARPSWARFTILDLGFLIAGLAAGFAATRGRVVSTTSIADLAFGTLVGSVLPAPVVIFRQYRWGGRTEKLGAGEWIWLSGSGFWLLSVLLSLIAWTNPSSILPVITVTMSFIGYFYHPTAMVLSLVVLVRLAASHRTTSCPWSDLFGLAYGAFIGPICLATIIFCPRMNLL